MRRHNEVAKAIHWGICKHFDIKVPPTYWRHVPDNVTENQDVRLLWDFAIQTDRSIQKSKRKVLIIDIAVPKDRNIHDKEKKEIEKYQDLKLREMEKWRKGGNGET